MKPSFALNLTETSLMLLHRTARGWQDLGTVAFDTPDLTAALTALRSHAEGLAPKGFTTKLILPESQILYLQIEAEGPDDTRRRAQIDAALDGRTPYALDDLVYDWSGTGSVVTVAVVARETLAEAEGFATEHGFNPVGFVAMPDTGFEREPFFGASALAATLLKAGETVEPDAAPVRILASAMASSQVAAFAEEPAVFDGAPAETGKQSEKPEEFGGDAASKVLEKAEAAPEADAPDAPTTAEVRFVPEQAPDLTGMDLPGPVAPEPDMPEPGLPEPDVPVSDPMPGPAPEPDLPPAQPDVPPAAPPDHPVSEPDLPPMPPTGPTFARPERASSFVAAAPDRAEEDARSGQVRAKASAAPDGDAAEAPMAVDVPPEDVIDDVPPMPAGARQSVLASRAPAADALPPAPSAAALSAFSSRRQDTAPRPLGAALSGLAPRDSEGRDAQAAPLATRDMVANAPMATTTDAGTSRPAVPLSTRPTAVAKPVVERPAAARPAPKFSYDDPLPPPTRLPGDPPTPPAAVAAKSGKGFRGFGGLVTAPTIPGTRKKKPVLNGAAPGAVPGSPRPAALSSGGTLAAPLDGDATTATIRAASQSLGRQQPVSPDAIAKGLSARTMPVRGKPKYLGLILTAALLLLLALVAAWSSFYLAGEEDPAAESQVAGFEDEAIADGQVPEAAHETAADVRAGLQDAADLPVDIDLSDAAPETAAVAPVALPDVTPVAAEPAPQTGVDGTLAEANQPDATGQDEIFLAGMDTPPALRDPLLLPAPAAQGDAPPAAQMPPPPFGTVYQFDAAGRILPTADGIMTPEGVLLVAGAPPVVPPQRPATVAAPDAASVTAAVAAAVADPVPAPQSASTAGVSAGPTAAAGDPQPAQTFAADPSLADARPRLRPEGLGPAVASDDDAALDPSLAPAPDSRFASLRPRARPPAILAAGEAARSASASASLAVQMAVVGAAADGSISPLAVPVSRVPAPRPRDMTRAVEAAIASATRQTQPDVVAAASTAARQPPTAYEADDEPEVASAAPSIPTRANVAQQATFANAINLSKINLIGVYGTQSNRYALVRQANGRFRKVSVGDSLDGGRVQAITASEVRYQKGGRLLALSMPRG